MATTSTSLRQRAGVLLVLLGLIAAMAPVTLAAPAWAENSSSLGTGTTCDDNSFPEDNKVESEGKNGTVSVSGDPETSDWGSVSWQVDQGDGAKVAAATINEGWTVEVCVKTGQGSDGQGVFLFTLDSSTALPFSGEFANGISHVSWRNPVRDTTTPANLELLKVWLDADGELIAAPDDVFWAANVRYLDGEELAGTPILIGSDAGILGDVDVDDSYDGYVVQERQSDAFDEIVCDPQELGRVAGFADGRAVEWGGTGDDYALPTVDTLHVICNQLTSTPDQPTLELLKVWTGDDAEVQAVFDVTFLGEASSDPVEVAAGGSIAIPDGVTGVRIDERVPGLGGCTSMITDVSDDLPVPGDEESLDFRAAEESTADYEVYFDSQQVESFTVTFTNDVDCPSIAATPSRAFVEVLKEWTVDGTVVDAPEGAAPEFDVTLSLGTVDIATENVAAGGTASFVGGLLTSGATYGVTVTEDADTLPVDPFTDEARTCEFVETTYAPTDATVRASATGGSVTVTATNVYECSEVAGQSFSALEVDVDKVWNATTADDGLTELAAPAGYTPTFEVTLTDVEGVAIGEAQQFAPGATVAFSELVDGDEYGLVWTEVNPLATFANADNDVCTLNDEQSVIGGTESLIGGEDTAVTLDARNVYDCPAVLGVTVVADDAEEIADTGVPALLLTLLGLASMGLGGGLLRRTKRS